MSVIRSYDEILKFPLWEGISADHRIPQPPEGYEIVSTGKTQEGDAQYCHSHGWEECIDYPTPVNCFNAIVRRSETVRHSTPSSPLGALSVDSEAQESV